MACTAYELSGRTTVRKPITVPTHTPGHAVALPHSVELVVFAKAYICTRCHLLYVEEPK